MITLSSYLEPINFNLDWNCSYSLIDFTMRLSGYWFIIFLIFIIMNSIKLYKSDKWNIMLFLFDIFLISIVLITLLNNLYYIFNKLIQLSNTEFLNVEFIFNMTSNGKDNIPAVSDTKTTIIHSNEGWAQGIKSIFIYGTGALRLQLLRGGGTPLQRGFVISSTIVADAASTALKNAINDPVYVEKHINSWSRIFKGTDNSTLEFNVDKDPETLGKLTDLKNKFISDDIGDSLINSLINILKPILEPVSVEYSKDILANQIYGISVILFVLSVLILILLLFFMINIIILVYSDKLMNFFKNKFIRWYIAFNKKIIGIEIWFLGSSIIYFMYMLSYGIHFIATHPINNL